MNEVKEIIKEGKIFPKKSRDVTRKFLDTKSKWVKMGLEEEFGLFKKTSKGNTLFSGRKRDGVSALSGLFRPVISPLKRTAKSKVSGFVGRSAKKLFEKPPRKLTTMEVLELEQKATLKRLRKKKLFKTRAKKIASLEKEFMEW